MLKVVGADAYPKHGINANGAGGTARSCVRGLGVAVGFVGFPALVIAPNRREPLRVRGRK